MAGKMGERDILEMMEDESFQEFKWCVLILLEKTLKGKAGPFIVDYLVKVEEALLDRYLEECNLYGTADPNTCAKWLIDIFPNLPMQTK